MNGRLPLKLLSDRHGTLGKRASDDYQHFIFRRRKQSWAVFLVSETVCRYFCPVLKELPGKGAQNQIPGEFLL